MKVGIPCMHTLKICQVSLCEDGEGLGVRLVANGRLFTLSDVVLGM